MIKNNAVVNEDVMGNVKELQAEIRKLKEQLSEMRKTQVCMAALFFRKLKFIPNNN